MKSNGTHLPLHAHTRTCSWKRFGMSGLGVARVCLGVPGGVRRGRRWEERGNRGVETRAAPRASQIGVVTRAIFLRPRHRVAGGRVWRRVHASSVSSDAASTADTEDPKEPEKKPLPFRVPAKPPSLLVVPATPIPTIEEVLTETETKNVFAFLARKKKPKPPTGVRARDVITETVRLTFRDFAATVVLAVCAGAAAQVVNLGGTFLLAIAGVHEVDIVAAAFLLAVQVSISQSPHSASLIAHTRLTLYLLSPSSRSKSHRFPCAWRRSATRGMLIVLMSRPMAVESLLLLRE